MRHHFRRILCALLALALCLPLAALADVSITIIGEDGEQEQLQTVDSDEGDAREAFIDGIIDLAKEKFDEAGGQPQRAHYSGDIYVCKNFTVYLFRENRDRFRMAEYPDTPLVIPDNKPREECTDYVYGVEWKDVPASEGNPFYVAASFRYDPDKTKEEKMRKATGILMACVALTFGAGTMAACKPEEPQVTEGAIYVTEAKSFWAGIGSGYLSFEYREEPAEPVEGERYGYVQYDAVKEIDWFVDAFCRKKYGATLYRLRDDIIWAE